jgi:hypothetical protein
VIYIQKQSERGRINEVQYDVEMGSGDKDLFRNSQVDGTKEIKRHIESRQHGDCISMLLFFQTKDNRLKSLYIIYIGLRNHQVFQNNKLCP